MFFKGLSLWISDVVAGLELNWEHFYKPKEKKFMACHLKYLVPKF